jgi:hypothetical protein
MSASAYCTTCSEELEEGLRFCTSCGTPIDEADDTVDVDDTDDVAELTFEQQMQAVADPVPARPEPADVIIRRGTRRSPLLPPPEYDDDDDDSDVVISRNWATIARNRAIPNQVGKSRKIAGDLPAWEPLPPGEAIVTRRPPRGAAK